jgi:hypothetical protein
VLKLAEASFPIEVRPSDATFAALLIFVSEEAIAPAGALTRSLRDADHSIIDSTYREIMIGALRYFSAAFFTVSPRTAIQRRPAHASSFFRVPSGRRAARRWAILPASPEASL